MKKKIVKLTEGDLEKLVKKIIKEDGGKVYPPSHGPITFEYVREWVVDYLEANLEGYEEIPSDKLDMAKDMIAKEILEEFHDNLWDMGDRYQYIMDDVFYDIFDQD